ncbi:MAG: hypothetical protein V1684_02360 [bacterium]
MIKVGSASAIRQPTEADGGSKPKLYQKGELSSIISAKIDFLKVEEKTAVSEKFGSLCFFFIPEKKSPPVKLPSAIFNGANIDN